MWIDRVTISTWMRRSVIFFAKVYFHQESAALCFDRIRTVYENISARATKLNFLSQDERNGMETAFVFSQSFENFVASSRRDGKVAKMLLLYLIFPLREWKRISSQDVPRGMSTVHSPPFDVDLSVELTIGIRNGRAGERHNDIVEIISRWRTERSASRQRSLMLFKFDSEAIYGCFDLPASSPPPLLVDLWWKYRK